MSTSPIRANARFTASPSATSQQTAVAPVFPATAFAAAWFFSYKNVTRSPRAANSATAAAPIPREPPVITTFPIEFPAFRSPFPSHEKRAAGAASPYLKSLAEESRPQAANKIESFSAGACTWQKIPLRLQSVRVSRLRRPRSARSRLPSHCSKRPTAFWNRIARFFTAFCSWCGDPHAWRRACCRIRT